MKNCIFSSHCTELICDKACPILVETSYLLERNNIPITSKVFNAQPQQITNALSILNIADSKFKIVVTDDTIFVSNLLTYTAICQHWHGNRLHCNVYHLNFSNHLNTIQHSWSVKDTPENLEYENIWVASAKVLIISNIDYVQFNDFQSQTLLNLIHNRMNNGLTTIVVSPKIQTLIGSGSFYNKLQTTFGGAVIKW